MGLELSSPTFVNNTPIPVQYTCDASNIAPALSWQGAPSETKSFVLLVDDPDAPNGDWVHWVLFNIPADTRQLAEGGMLPYGAINGKNSWGTQGYRGPCPPSGTHRYFFKLYALNTLLPLNGDSDKKAVEIAIENHILSSSQLIGLYTRK